MRRNRQGQNKNNKTTKNSAQLFVKEKEYLNQLFQTCKQGDVEKLKQLLENRIKDHSIDTFKDASKRTLLHFACHSGQLNMVKYLVEIGADVNLKDDEDGDTPLSLAILKNHPEIVNFLIDTGKCDFTITTLSTKTLVHKAVIANNIPLVDLFVTKNISINQADSIGPPLIYAVIDQNIPMIKHLITLGSNVNQPNEFDHAPALSMAASIGSLEVVELLLSNGADIKIENDENWTALHCAAEGGHLEIVKKLVEAGIDPSKFTKSGQTALHLYKLKVSESNSDLSTDPVVTYLTPITKKEFDTLNFKPRKPIQKNLDKETKQKVADLKAEGNRLFGQNEWNQAIEKYTEALKLDNQNSIIFNNRAACWLNLKDYKAAIEDATQAKNLNPNWAKPYGRMGTAYVEMEDYEEAAFMFFEGLQKEPGNKELQQMFNDAVEKGKAKNKQDS